MVKSTHIVTMISQLFFRIIIIVSFWSFETFLILCYASSLQWVEFMILSWFSSTGVYSEYTINVYNMDYCSYIYENSGLFCLVKGIYSSKGKLRQKARILPNGDYYATILKDIKQLYTAIRDCIIFVRMLRSCLKGWSTLLELRCLFLVTWLLLLYCLSLELCL